MEKHATFDAVEQARNSPPGRRSYPVIKAIECKGCGRCVVACPQGLLRMGTQFNERGCRYVEYCGEGCEGCADCYYTCPEPGAIEIHLPRPARRRGDGQGD